MLTPITHTHTSTHSQTHAHTRRLAQRVVKSKSKAKSLMQDLRVYKTTRPIDKKKWKNWTKTATERVCEREKNLSPKTY